MLPVLVGKTPGQKEMAFDKLHIKVFGAPSLACNVRAHKRSQRWTSTLATCANNQCYKHR